MTGPWNTLHPVVMAVPYGERDLKGRRKVAALGRYARQALERSAQFSGVTLGTLRKRENGAPLPSRGIHWSLTHKSAYVAAVAAPQPVGIDIEKIRSCSRALYDRIATPDEWGLAPAVSRTLFFRFWTAKEAVLKAVGQGLTGLSDCRIRRIDGTDRLIVQYRDSEWEVVHYAVGGDHLATITRILQAVEWHMVAERN